MDSVKKWQTRSLSYENTVHLGEQLGANAKGGEVIEMISDLGGGKTAFVTGLARGVGSEDQVSSPTFMISRVYYGRTLTVHHFDFYRLEEPGMIAQQLAEVQGDPGSIVIVEWGDIVHDVLPLLRCKIEIARAEEHADDRLITCSYPEQYDYLFDGLIL